MNWNVYLAVLSLMLVVLLAFRKYPSYGKKTHPIPRMKCCSLLFYTFYFASFLRQSATIDEFLCILLQILSGFCFLFDKMRICQVHIFEKHVICLFKPETVQAILNSSVNIEKAKEYDLLNTWLGTSLAISSGEKWHHRRKLLTPSFHLQILKDFMPIVNEQSGILLSKLRKLNYETWIDIVPVVNSCSLDVICETAMGVSIKAQSGGCNEFVDAIKKACNSFFYRLLRPWLYFDCIYNISSSGRNLKHNLNIIHSFTGKVIKDKKEEMLAAGSASEEKEKNYRNTKKRKAFLESLIDIHLKDPSFTEEDIREEVDLFMFAGHDSSAIGVCWSLYCVGLHENVQQLIHEELDAIFKEENEREITKEDLANMKYLECVIKETLRLYSPVPFIARKVVQKLEILGYTIEPGSIAFVALCVLHRDPESFPNPEKFDPERFLPENASQRHPFAYIPFSAGPRNCIGQKFAMMEMKTILANIFRKLTVISRHSRDKMNVRANIVIHNNEPLEIRFIPRKET